MAGIGTAAGIIGEFFAPVMVAVATITSFTTPMLVKVGPKIAAAIDHRLPNRLRTLLSLYEVWIEALRTRPREKKGLRRPLFVLGLDVVFLVGLSIGGRMIYPGLSEWLMTTFGMSDVVARILFVSVQLLAWIPVLVSVSRTAKVLARRVGEQLLPTRAGAPDLAAAPRRALTIGLQMAVVVAVSTPLAMLTGPIALGSGIALVPLVLPVVLLPILWRDASNLGGHVRASAEVVLAALRQGNDGEPERIDVHAGELDQLLPGLGHVEVIELGEHSHGNGRSLGDLDIHAQTGAMVLALARQDGGRVRPGPEVVLQAGDRVVVLGAADCLAQARARLDAAPSESLQAQPDRVDAKLSDPV